MNIGLYHLKMPFRKLLMGLLPLFKNTNPNAISWWLLPVGLAMAACYVLCFQEAGANYFLLVAILLGFVRMIVATLDGLVAVTYNKSSIKGDLINRLTPELCDFILYVTLVFALRKFDLIGLLALGLIWLTTFMGLLGAPSGLPVQSVGPVGQTDRLATLMLFSFLEYLSRTFSWGISFFDWFFYWLVIGGAITISNRFYRTLQEAKRRQ
jgi:phosphatidylglycerophosphate synthase